MHVFFRQRLSTVCSRYISTPYILMSIEVMIYGPLFSIILQPVCSKPELLALKLDSLSSEKLWYKRPSFSAF